MNYIKLFQMQAELDSKIVEGKQLEGVDLFNKKVQALLTEIQETANEWRGFKFWSKDQEPRVCKIIRCEDCGGQGFFLGYSNSQIDCEKCVGTGIEKEFNPLLEETVDTAHFIYSLGNDLAIDPEEVANQLARAYDDLTSQFIALSYVATCMAMYNDKKRYYLEVVSHFKGLVALLGFTEGELETAYYSKNKINHDRQATGY